MRGAVNSDSGRGSPRAGLEGAVGDAVVHRAEIGQIEQVAHPQSPFRAQRSLDVQVLREREVHRDRLRAGADLERHAVIPQQQSKLLLVVAVEQVGPRQRRLVGARAGDESVAQARVGARHRVGVHAHERIARAHVLGEVFAGDETLQRLAQVSDARLVNGAHLRECGGRIFEAGGRDEQRQRGYRFALGHAAIVRRARGLRTLAAIQRDGARG